MMRQANIPLDKHLAATAPAVTMILARVSYSNQPAQQSVHAPHNGHDDHPPHASDAIETFLESATSKCLAAAVFGATNVPIAPSKHVLTRHREHYT
jgi:hypothetical protein